MQLAVTAKWAKSAYFAQVCCFKIIFVAKMKTLLHPPLLERVLNTLAVKPQETKHGPTCLSESHDKLENLALCGLTPSSTCNASSFERISKSQSSFFWTMLEGKKVIDVIDMWAILHQSRMIQQSMPETRTFPWGEQAGCDWWRAQIDHSCTKKVTAVTAMVELNRPMQSRPVWASCLQCPWEVTVTSLSFPGSEGFPAATPYSTPQFFAKCCQFQRLNDKNGEIW